MNFGNPKVPSEISSLRKLHAKAGPNTLNLGLGQPEVDMPEELRHIAKEAIESNALGYTPNAGRVDLRDLVAQNYGLKTDELLIIYF